jgi:hypothetical protein
MRTPNLAAVQGADVAMPQAAAFTQFSCQFRALWAIVHVGRTQAAFTSHKGAAQSTLPANKWSRGCRALKSPFLHFAWSLSWPLAPRKKKKSFTSMNRLFRPSLFTPASTSKTKGRALWAVLARPALFLFAVSAEDHRPARARFASADDCSYGGCICNDTTQRQTCAPLPFSPFFLPALSQLAPSQHPSRWLTPFRCRKSLFRPANTSDLTGRAGSLRPAPFDRPFHAKVQSC